MSYTFNEQLEVSSIIMDFVDPSTQEFDPLKAITLSEFVLKRACLSSAPSCVKINSKSPHQNCFKRRLTGFASGFGNVEIELDDESNSNEMNKKDDSCEVWVGRWSLSFIMLKSGHYNIYLQDRAHESKLDPQAKPEDLPFMFALSYNPLGFPVSLSKIEYKIKRTRYIPLLWERYKISAIPCAYKRPSPCLEAPAP